MLASDALDDKLSALAEKRIKPMPWAQFSTLLVGMELRLIPPVPLAEVQELSHK